VSLDPTTAWLLGLGDDPGPEARAEALAVDLPPGLAEATLAAVRADSERSGAAPKGGAPAGALVTLRPRRRWLAAASAAAAIAAGALLSLDVAPRVGDPDVMVARGQAPGGPEVHLKAALRRGGAPPARFSPDDPPRAGDLLYFRYQVAGEGWLYLLRQPEGGPPELLHREAVSAGERDLRRGGEPLAWSVDAGDPAAEFALVTAAEDHPDPAGALAGRPGAAGDLCGAAAALGWRCDALSLAAP